MRKWVRYEAPIMVCVELDDTAPDGGRVVNVVLGTDQRAITIAEYREWPDRPDWEEGPDALRYPGLYDTDEPDPDDEDDPEPLDPEPLDLDPTAAATSGPPSCAAAGRRAAAAPAWTPAGSRAADHGERRVGRRERKAHLQTLKAAHLVQTRKDGVKVDFQLAGPDVAALYGHLQQVAAAHLSDLAPAAAAYLGPDDTEVVAYCRGAYCVLSYDAVRLLTSHGRTARRLADGVLEWTLADLPLANSTTSQDVA